MGWRSGVVGWWRRSRWATTQAPAAPAHLSCAASTRSWYVRTWLRFSMKSRSASWLLLFDLWLCLRRPRGAMPEGESITLYPRTSNLAMAAPTTPPNGDAQQTTWHCGVVEPGASCSQCSIALYCKVSARRTSMFLAFPPRPNPHTAQCSSRLTLPSPRLDRSTHPPGRMPAGRVEAPPHRMPGGGRGQAAGAGEAECVPAACGLLHSPCPRRRPLFQ